MGVTLPNIEAQPVFLEQYPRIGEYVQGGHGTETDYYNQTSKTVLPGEPLILFGRLCISKDIILPGHFGTVVSDCWVNYLLDPDLASNILQGAAVYYDLGLADAGEYISGYATNVQPTNGYLLGHAIGVHATPEEVNLSAGSAIAARPGDNRVFVLLTRITPTSYGTIVSALTTS